MRIKNTETAQGLDYKNHSMIGAIIFQTEATGTALFASLFARLEEKETGFLSKRLRFLIWRPSTEHHRQVMICSSKVAYQLSHFINSY